MFKGNPFSPSPVGPLISKGKTKTPQPWPLIVEDELSTEQPHNAEDTGVPVSADQVKLALTPSFPLPRATGQNLSGRAVLTGLGCPQLTHLRVSIFTPTPPGAQPWVTQHQHLLCCDL